MAPPLILYDSAPLPVAFTTIVPVGTAQVGCVMVGAVIVIIPCTNTVAVIGVPGQPLAVGVMVKVTVTAELVVLVNTPLISPAPLAAIPVTVAVLSLVQL